MAISKLTRRLVRQLQVGLPPSEQRGFLDNCFHLARFIDYAVSHYDDNDISIDTHELAAVMKQVYAHRSENFVQTAIILLMVSLKNACNSNWFAADDADELIKMADEIRSSFGISDGIISNTGKNVESISNIMQRFFPLMELNSLIATFKVKPGYELLVGDVYTPKAIGAGQSLRLFVAQTDNVETSSCIITPPQVNFLINGKAIKRRTNIVQDKNPPQLPTDITGMIKCGLNILQAIGSFSGNYIISIAVMCERNLTDVSTIQNYIDPASTEDVEITEGPSRISLNCPISMKRIETPIKGQLCKHLQCFDYASFMNINAKNPCWRCPLCNQPVSYVDIRIDQNMATILKDANEDICNVMIFADKSWKPAEFQGITSLSVCNTHKSPNKESLACVTNNPGLSSSIEIVDLTVEGYSQVESGNERTYQDGVAGLSVLDTKPVNAGSSQPTFGVTTWHSCSSTGSISSGENLSNFRTYDQTHAPWNHLLNPCQMENHINPSFSTNYQVNSQGVTLQHSATMCYENNALVQLHSIGNHSIVTARLSTPGNLVSMPMPSENLQNLSTYAICTSSQQMHQTSGMRSNFSAPVNSFGHLAYGDRRTTTNSNLDSYPPLTACNLISPSSQLQQRMQVSQVHTFQELVSQPSENCASRRIQPAQKMAVASHQAAAVAQLREVNWTKPFLLHSDKLSHLHTYQGTQQIDTRGCSRLPFMEVSHSQNSNTALVGSSLNPQNQLSAGLHNASLATLPARHVGSTYQQNQISLFQHASLLARLQIGQNQGNAHEAEMSARGRQPGGH